jgi:pimeloyl-ACP methyl ester carboxylesterase
VTVGLREEKVLLDLGDHRVASMHIRIWGPAGKSRGTVFCVHGYTGNGADFHYLAQCLCASGYSVVCPDMLGRGQSSYLRDPKLYNYELFVTCLRALSRYEHANNVFIGSSWGAMVVLLFLRMSRTRCSRLILNDICMRSGQDLEAKRDNIVGDSAMSFADRAEARAYLIKTRPYLGDLDEARVDEYVRNKLEAEGARLRLSFDAALPASLEPQRGRAFDLYPLLSKMPIPTLLLYGQDSPFLEEDRLRRLCLENPRIRYVADIRAGHPPSLMNLHEALLVSGYVGLSHTG